MSVEREFMELVAFQQAPVIGKHKGTVKTVSNGTATVLLDGGESATVCTTVTTTCHAGNRVVVEIDPVTRSASVVGNITDPSASSQTVKAVQNYAETAAGFVDTVSRMAAEVEKDRDEVIKDMVEAGEGLEKIKKYVGYSEEAAQTIAERVEEVDQQAKQGIADIADDVAAIDEAYKAADAAIGASVQAASESAARAEVSASSAHDSARSALSSARGAAYGLSDVEKVLDTVTWIAERGTFEPSADPAPVDGTSYYARDSGGAYSSGGYRYSRVDSPTEEGMFTYALTEDTAVDSSKTYYTRTGEGTEESPYAYEAVAEPTDDDVAAYYERTANYYVLTVQEAVANYLMSHLWQDDYGLNLMVDDAAKHRAHLGTFDGTYQTGLHVVDQTGAVVASFTDQVTLGKLGMFRAVVTGMKLSMLDSAGLEVASFSPSGAVVGLPTGRHALMTTDGVTVSSANVATVADLPSAISEYATLTIFQASYLIATLAATCTVMSDTFVSFVEGGVVTALFDADNVIFYDGFGTAAANVTARYGRHGMKATVTIGDLR